eukprot:1146208-Pelagomonas_calceolata.AAC.19
MLEHGKEGTVLTGSFQGWLYKPELWRVRVRACACVCSCVYCVTYSEVNLLQHHALCNIVQNSLWLLFAQGLTRNPSKAGTDGNTPPRTAESYADSQAVGEDGEGGEQVSYSGPVFHGRVLVAILTPVNICDPLHATCHVNTCVIKLKSSLLKTLVVEVMYIERILQADRSHSWVFVLLPPTCTCQMQDLIPDIPPSWVPKMVIPRDAFDMRCPRGSKLTLYKKCQHEIFALFGDSSRWDGMVEKIVVYELGVLVAHLQGECLAPIILWHFSQQQVVPCTLGFLTLIFEMTKVKEVKMMSAQSKQKWSRCSNGGRTSCESARLTLKR